MATKPTSEEATAHAPGIMILTAHMKGRGGPMIERPCIVDLGYVIGGGEGRFLVETLLGMFTSWADRHGLLHDILDGAPAFGGGLDSAKLGICHVDRDMLATLHQGAHTMIRVPPDNVEKRRHMSVAGIRISDDPNLPLPKEMADWGEERRRYFYDPYRAITDSRLGRLEVDPDVVLGGDFSALGMV